MRHYHLSAALLLVLLSFVFTVPAQAGIGWCKSDPVVSIDGQLADIIVSAPLDAPTLVTGPTEIVVMLPRGVDGAVVASDLGFGQGERVTFKTWPALRVTSDGIQLRIAVYVPATDDTMPVEVEFAPHIVGILTPAWTSGTANTWIILTTVM